MRAPSGFHLVAYSYVVLRRRQQKRDEAFLSPKSRGPHEENDRIRKSAPMADGLHLLGFNCQRQVVLRRRYLDLGVSARNLGNAATANQGRIARIQGILPQAP